VAGLVQQAADVAVWRLMTSGVVWNRAAMAF